MATGGESAQALVLVPSLLALDPASFIRDYPAPALLLDGGGRVVAANDQALPLEDAVVNRRDGAILDLVSTTSAGRRAVAKRITLPGRDGHAGLALDLTLLPLDAPDGGYVLMLARDATFERNFCDALIVSRELFRDVVACSADFAWETRADGRFSFVSPRGALGYAARELVERGARELLAGDVAAPEPFPFETAAPCDSVETCLRRADGGLALLLVSAVPVRGKDGTLRGARGVCRDVTEARRRDAELLRSRQREQLQARIADAVRTEVDPARALDRTVEAVAGALGAGGAWILRARSEDGSAMAASHALNEARSVLAAARALGDAAMIEGRAVEQVTEGWRGLAMPARCHDSAKGAICVVRDESAPPWDEDARLLLGGVADRLGVTLAQIETLERLERLSRVDDLTGLLNRRALLEMLTQRLEHLRRMERKAALLYLDLDDFKPVNDHLGHDAGDQVLREVGMLLRRASRAGDVAGRLGGDEFALWLEEVDEAGALRKAELLLKGCREIGAGMAAHAPPLGASIGITFTSATPDETIATVIVRADRAMYAAKKGGKGGVVALAPGAAEASS